MGLIFLVLDGNTPSKKNSKRVFSVKGRSYPVVLPSEGYARWHKRNIAHLPESATPANGKGRISFPLPSIVRISVKFYRDSLRKWDYSNALESVQDILVDARILADDNVKELCIGFLTHAIDRENPRAEVFLEYGLTSGVVDDLMEGVRALGQLKNTVKLQRSE